MYILAFTPFALTVHSGPALAAHLTFEIAHVLGRDAGRKRCIPSHDGKPACGPGHPFWGLLRQLTGSGPSLQTKWLKIPLLNPPN